MDKLERLLTLTLTLLHTTHPLTAEELRDRVGGYPEDKAAFRRAFERDKDDLRELGVPIRLSPIPYRDPPADGYHIPADEYYLRDPGLTTDELAALHLAAIAVHLDGARGLAGLWRLGGQVGGAPEGPTLASVPGDENLGPLFGAVADRRTVSFSYRDRRRTVDPWRLDFQRGRWYLRAFDHARGEERNFRVDRIDGDVEVGERAGAFARPEHIAGVPAQAWQLGEAEPVEARLLVDPPLAPWARSFLGEELVAEERPDGAVVLAVPVADWPAFRSFVLTFLEHAELLDPPELRDRLLTWLEEVAR